MVLANWKDGRSLEGWQGIGYALENNKKVH